MTTEHSTSYCYIHINLSFSFFLFYIFMCSILSYNMCLYCKMFVRWWTVMFKSYSNRIAFMLCLFLFHIDSTIYAYRVFIKTTMSNKVYRTHYKIQSVRSNLTSLSTCLWLWFHFNKYFLHCLYTVLVIEKCVQ